MEIEITLLYHQLVEQLFIDGMLPRHEVVKIIGIDRVNEIEYAQQVLAQDVAQGLQGRVA